MCTKKEDWCYYSNAKHTSKGLYLPILTNERSSARMIGQAIAVPFLLFLFHTIKRNLLLINIGARGSTPTHRPEWMSKASCSYRPGFYLLITYDRACSHQHRSMTETGMLRSSFHSIIPATRTREICLLWKCCFRLRSMWQSKRRKDVAQGLVQSQVLLLRVMRQTTSFSLSLCSVRSSSSTGKPMKLFLPRSSMPRLIMF